jgi:hypothetical protein
VCVLFGPGDFEIYYFEKYQTTLLKYHRCSSGSSQYNRHQSIVMEETQTRRSGRVSSFRASYRIEKLFFDVDSMPELPRNVEVLCRKPAIYRINNFLSEGEYSFLNKICTQYRWKFHKSFTENDDNERVSAACLIMFILKFT